MDTYKQLILLRSHGCLPARSFVVMHLKDFKLSFYMRQSPKLKKKDNICELSSTYNVTLGNSFQKLLYERSSS